MNNNKILARLTDIEKNKFMYLMAHCIVNCGRHNIKIERVLMCNMNIKDKLMVVFMDVLIENKDDIDIKELWLESNRIGDHGMDKLGTLIGLNLNNLSVIKLYNNKKDVSTRTCNK